MTSKKFFNNEPTVLVCAGVAMRPGPNGFELTADEYMRVRDHVTFRKWVREGSITRDSYRQREPLRPRMRPQGEHIEVDPARPSRRRAERRLVSAGVPDRDLVAELEGKVADRDSEITYLKAKVARLESEMSDKPAPKTDGSVGAPAQKPDAPAPDASKGQKAPDKGQKAPQKAEK